MCSTSSKCKEGDGHCSVDEDCAVGLKCGKRNCVEKMNGITNCCYLPDGRYRKKLFHCME